MNIIGVDWGKLSSHNNLPHYFIAANNAIKVGKHAGSLLTKMLVQDLGVNPKNIHAIGHSLGAHVVGHFGRTIQSELNEIKISRITGNSLNITVKSIRMYITKRKNQGIFDSEV